MRGGGGGGDIKFHVLQLKFDVYTMLGVFHFQRLVLAREKERGEEWKEGRKKEREEVRKGRRKKERKE